MIVSSPAKIAIIPKIHKSGNLMMPYIIEGSFYFRGLRPRSPILVNAWVAYL